MIPLQNCKPWSFDLPSRPSVSWLCFLMQQARLKERSRVRASFLLIQLWRASVCKASERFSLQQWTSWMILNQAFFFFVLPRRTPGPWEKLSSETNSHPQNTNSLPSDIASTEKNKSKTFYRWGGWNSVFFFREGGCKIGEIRAFV